MQFFEFQHNMFHRTRCAIQARESKVRIGCVSYIQYCAIFAFHEFHGMDASFTESALQIVRKSALGVFGWAQDYKCIMHNELHQTLLNTIPLPQELIEYILAIMFNEIIDIKNAEFYENFCGLQNPI